MFSNILFTGFPAPEIPGCMNPLGMESGQISNNYVQASSQAYSTTGPENARLHFKGARECIGAWIPKTHNRNEWLQIDFGNETRITGISTQGRYDADQWVMSYSLRYSYNGLYFIQYWPHLHTKVHIK